MSNKLYWTQTHAAGGEASLASLPATTVEQFTQRAYLVAGVSLEGFAATQLDPYALLTHGTGPVDW